MGSRRHHGTFAGVDADTASASSLAEGWEGPRTPPLPSVSRRAERGFETRTARQMFIADDLSHGRGAVDVVGIVF